LTPFITTRQKDDDAFALSGKIDAISGPKHQTQFQQTSPKVPVIARVTGSYARKPSFNARDGF
jgi:hypothetical protein